MNRLTALQFFQIKLLIWATTFAIVTYVGDPIVQMFYLMMMFGIVMTDILYAIFGEPKHEETT